MTDKIDFTVLLEFGAEMKIIRRMFPEFAREIDRAIYDAGQKSTPRCGEANCVCHWSFERFHAEQNLAFRRDGEKA